MENEEVTQFHPSDYYPYTAKEKVLKEASKFYNELSKGLTTATISTAAELHRGDSDSDSDSLSF